MKLIALSCRSTLAIAGGGFFDFYKNSQVHDVLDYIERCQGPYVLVRKKINNGQSDEYTFTCFTAVPMAPNSPLQEKLFSNEERESSNFGGQS
jgi:hypothetical protein